MTKICKYCGVEQSMDGFYDHPRMKDGKHNKCIACFLGRSAVPAPPPPPATFDDLRWLMAK